MFVTVRPDTISGVVHCTLKGKKIEHIGMKVELIGQIEMNYDRGNPYEFTSLVRELESPGEITEVSTGGSDNTGPYHMISV